MSVLAVPVCGAQPQEARALEADWAAEGQGGAGGGGSGSGRSGEIVESPIICGTLIYINATFLATWSWAVARGPSQTHMCPCLPVSLACRVCMNVCGHTL